LGLTGASVVAWNARSVGDALISRRVDAYVAKQLSEQHIPGIGLGVMRGGKLLKASGYGLANVELDVAVTPETVFELASVSKQFTATAVMMLVEAGSVKLEDKIPKYFPEGAEVWKDVTVRHLLSHTSGIPDYGAETETKAKAIVDFRKDYTEDQLVQIFAGVPLEFTPGDKWSYSNTGYVLLGILIHRVTGQFYGDMLQQRIFGPLGMTSTRVISEADIVKHRAAGYRLVDDKLKNQDWASPSLNRTADGSLLTNVLDMARWDAALYTENVLREADLELMWAKARLNDGSTVPYGLGWGTIRLHRHRLVRHRGAWQGFTSTFLRYVDDRLSVVVLANMADPTSRPEVIGRAVAAMYLPDLAEDP
jgi:CubicO group peptidase (beta-lactamase class C family)